MLLSIMNTMFENNGIHKYTWYQTTLGRSSYFEDLLNPTDTLSIEEVELEDSEEDLPITRAEITEAVKQFLSGRAPGVDEILSCWVVNLLTCLFKIVWRSGTVALDWQTVVVPIFKKGDQCVCSNFRGITHLSLHGNV